MFSTFSHRLHVLLAAAATIYFVTGLIQTAVAQVVPQASHAHIMWNGTDGTMSLWTVGDDGTWTHKEYGPFPGWTAKMMTDGADGMTNILWTHAPDGQVSLWKLDSAGHPVNTEYGPYPGWAAIALSRFAPGAGTFTGAAGGDLFGLFPNPTVAAGAITHTKLASDPGSLVQVSGGLLSTNDNFHVNVLHDLMVQGTVVALNGNGGGVGSNGGVGRALVDGGSANNLIINYANDFGRVSVQSELDVHGALGLEPGDIYANNDINIHRNTTVHGDFGVSGGNFGVDGAINLGGGTINSANDININKNTTVHGTMTATTIQITGGSDLAEPYKIAASAQVQPLPGMVVSIDPDQTGQMRVCARPYDNAVGGIISGAGGVQPGVVLRQTGTAADGTLPIASVGRV